MNRIPSASDIRRLVMGWVQPAYRGTITAVAGLKATLTNVIPFGTGDNFQLAFPFGFVSSPIKGVVAFVQNLNGSPADPVVLGQMDQNRPATTSGNVMLYNSAGEKIYLKDGKILVGAGTPTQPFVKGTVLKTLLDNLLTDLAAHTHAAPGAPPTQAAQFNALKASPVDDGTLLSTEIFGN